MIGTTGRIEVEIPFNALNDRPCRIRLDKSGDLTGAGIETIEFSICDQFTIQAERFAAAVRDGGNVVYPLDMSVRNMRLIDAVFRSAASGRWETPGSLPS